MSKLEVSLRELQAKAKTLKEQSKARTSELKAEQRQRDSKNKLFENALANATKWQKRVMTKQAIEVQEQLDKETDKLIELKRKLEAQIADAK